MGGLDRRLARALIDLALSACEEANLRAPREPEPWVRALIAELQAERARERVVAAADTVEAVWLLLDLQAPYLLPEPGACDAVTPGARDALIA